MLGFGLDFLDSINIESGLLFNRADGRFGNLASLAQASQTAISTSNQVANLLDSLQKPSISGRV
jgi:hypothetical protein